jgi:RNA polymerase sigma-70 factor (ECF subfamily)
VQGATPKTDPDLVQQRRVVDAFLAASRNGDFDALLEVLDPDVVFRADRGRLAAAVEAPALVTGAEDVARVILSRGSRFARFARPAIVNGNAGVVVAPNDRPIAVVGFTVTGGRIVEIDLIADPEKLERLPL